MPSDRNGGRVGPFWMNRVKVVLQNVPLKSVMATRRDAIFQCAAVPAVDLGVIGADYVSISLPPGYQFTVAEAADDPKLENN